MKRFVFKIITILSLAGLFQGYAYAQTLTPSPDVLSLALTSSLVRWQASPGPNEEYTAFNSLTTGKAMNYLALVAYHNPANDIVVERLLLHIRNVISGGREPTCRGTISGWADNALAQSLTLAKNTPAVWEQLTADEINKCDWLMRALTVAGNYNQNFSNSAQRCLLGEFTAAHKRNNPNIQEGYVGIMIAAHEYFGGTAAVNSMLSEFNYDTYLATFENLGFTNIVYGWTYAYGNTPDGRALMKTLMEQGGTEKGGGVIASQGVRRPFTFGDYSSPAAEVAYNPFQIFQTLAGRFYPYMAASRTNGGEGYILNGNTTPMAGLMGMCYEFQTTDGSGVRSSASYVYDGWMNSLLTYATLRALGVWGNTAAHQEIDRRIKVGSIDFLYKYKAGYYGRSNGEIFTYSEPTGTYMGYPFLKDIWINYLWDRKDMTVFELLAPTVTESFDAVTLGSDFSNGQFSGDKGLVWHFEQARQVAGAGVKPNDSKFLGLVANLGILRTTLTKPLRVLRFKVRNLLGSGSPSVTVRINGTVLRTYTGFGTDDTEVVTIANMTALSGDELIITNSGSVELLMDDLELEQVGMPEAPTNLTVSNIQMNELTLNWADNSDNETGFHLARRTLPDGTFQTVQSGLPVNSTSYVDKTVVAETNYEYSLTAINLAGASAAVLVSAETLPLVAQDVLLLSPVADAFVNAGTLAGTNFGARNFMNVKYSGANSNATRECFIRFDLSAVTKRIERADFRIYASGVEANLTNPFSASLSIIEQDDWDEATINWTNSRSFTSLGQIHQWDPVVNTNTVNPNPSLLQNQKGGLLTLRLSTTENLLATFGSREATSSSQRPLLTIYTDHITAPTSLLLSTSNGKPMLSWTDNASNETGFVVQRKQLDGGATGRIAAETVFADLATLGANTLTFTDESAQTGSRYVYRVYSLDATGKSAYSNLAEMNNPLPVTLIEFKAKKGEANTVILNWATSQEINSDFFAVERSIDGKNFIELGRVKSQEGPSTGKKYFFHDQNPVLNGELIYRLRMVDLDGTFAYSRLQSIHLDASPEIAIYPNPATERISILTSDRNPIRSVVVYDIRGHVQKRVENVVDFQISDLPQGLYVIRAVHNGKQHNLKLLKR
jgi:hypothetical protein